MGQEAQAAEDELRAGGGQEPFSLANFSRRPSSNWRNVPWVPSMTQELATLGAATNGSRMCTKDSIKGEKVLLPYMLLGCSSLTRSRIGNGALLVPRS